MSFIKRRKQPHLFRPNADNKVRLVEADTSNNPASEQPEPPPVPAPKKARKKKRGKR